jgi:HTH-type transcriptional regulator, competence development regulator
MGTKTHKPFGQALREKRIQKGHSLRKFAELVGVSPTYLSQVEQNNIDPPTAERVQRMAELLGENADEWIALAGRLPQDLPEIIQQQPTGMPELLREAKGLTAEQLRKLTEEARKLKRKGN